MAHTTWKLAEMPLPRLQRVGQVDQPFLYDLAWDERIRRRDFERESFDRSVTLRPGAGAELVRLAPLIRPLTERLWSARVTRYNRLPEGQLEEFLFRRARLDAVRLRVALLELQNGRCFYTDRPLRPGESDVDHFVPWSRSPLQAIENLVVADRRVNNDKRDRLVADRHVERWRGRNARLASDLALVAAANRWESAPMSCLGVARSLYLSLDPDTPLWAGPGVFVAANTERLRAALAA